MIGNERAPRIEAKDLAKSYGGVRALKGVSLKFFGGEVHALVGENGAGKSTVGRIIAGVESPDQGELRLYGEPVVLGSPCQARAAGIAMVPQELDAFPNLTLGENMVIGNPNFKEGIMANSRQIEDFCRPFLEHVRLHHGTRVLVEALSIAEVQLLLIARALSMEAHMLIFDEPTSSLTQEHADRLMRLIETLKARDTGIIYVSHKMDEVFALSDRISILRDGMCVESRPAGDLDAREVIRHMVGRELNGGAGRRAAPQSKVILSVRGLVTAKLDGVSFDLMAGEVLGIAGLVGSGRSSLGHALAGLRPRRAGNLRLLGDPYDPTDAASALKSGFGLLPEDRKLQGLMMSMSIVENASLQRRRHGAARIFVSSEERTEIKGLIARLRLKTPSLDVPVNALSGGNQQKALLARLLLANPSVLFLDDPARGIDVGAKEDIYQIIETLCAEGKGILLASLELPELLRCCHRIAVMSEGQLVAVFNCEQVTQGLIMAACMRTAAA